VGGIVAGVAGLAIIAIVAYILFRRQRRGTGQAELAHEMPHEQKYEMESPAVEMPAGDECALVQKLAPSYAHELDVQNDSKDQNFKKPVSYA
jgi:hypothetical protein